MSLFSNYTYDVILADMLSRVSDDVDKRESSPIYAAVAPCAYKLAEYYVQLDNFMDLLFGDTASGEYLDRLVADFGITRKPATASLRKVTTSDAVTVGSRWGINDVVFDITAELSANVYSATCETAGAIGNTYSGTLSNIDNTSDVAATLADIITPGADEETDDALRERYFEQVQNPATSGNAAAYKAWALSVSGVGGAKVEALWNGAGTVKVLIVNNDMAIETDLESTVAVYIETVRPIGATVTVTSPTGKSIGVTAAVTLDGSQTIAAVQSAFTAAVTSYLKSTVFETYSVSYAKIGSLLLTTDGVSDYTDLQVNGGTSNIAIGTEELPIAGTITLTEASP